MRASLDSESSAVIDSAFNDLEYDDGFVALERSNKANSANIVADDNSIKRVGSGINSTKIVPLTLYTDIHTATQITMLLGMIRYCMESSAEGKSDENKEFTMSLHVRNRSKSDFNISVGDESIEALPYEKDMYIGH